MDGRLVHPSVVAEIRLARGAAIIQLTTDRLEDSITNQQITGIPGRLEIGDADASKLREAITEAQHFAKIDKEFEDLVNRTISMATFICELREIVIKVSGNTAGAVDPMAYKHVARIIERRWHNVIPVLGANWQPCRRYFRSK